MKQVLILQQKSNVSPKIVCYMCMFYRLISLCLTSLTSSWNKLIKFIIHSQYLLLGSAFKTFPRRFSHHFGEILNGTINYNSNREFPKWIKCHASYLCNIVTLANWIPYPSVLQNRNIFHWNFQTVHYGDTIEIFISLSTVLLNTVIF